MTHPGRWFCGCGDSVAKSRPRAHDSPDRDAIPWFWNWADRRYAVWWDSQGLPFVQRPNMLFLNSATPRIDAEECALLDAANCRAMFCHSDWYRDLIAQHRGPVNQSPIVMWPYPIDPWPGEPLPDEYGPFGKK